MDTEDWKKLTPVAGVILEVCLRGCSVGLGFASDEWFAIIIKEVSGTIKGAWRSEGPSWVARPSLTCRMSRMVFVDASFICPQETFASSAETNLSSTLPEAWRPQAFECRYLEAYAKAALTRARTAEERAASAGRWRARYKEASSQGHYNTSHRKRGLTSKKSAEEGRGSNPYPLSWRVRRCPALPRGSRVDPSQREHVRGLPRSTRERILGDGTARASEEGLNRGGGAAGSGRAAPGLDTGTSLNPTKIPWRIQEKMSGSVWSGKSASAALVARRKKRKKKRDKKDSPKRMVDLLSAKKKKKKKKRGRKDGQRSSSRIKPDPDDPGDSESSGSGSESSSSRSDGDEGRSDAGSDLSCEAPLQKQAAKEPGSVMRVVVKRAQEQLDRGSLLDTDDTAGSRLTSGIKISTYFARAFRGAKRSTC